ncbi:MAG: hypothetical protein KGJ13_11930 [Patescibacteria group bacterium]|nr:hypothetical protein [Patescibacteria group bacterium]
MGVSQHDINIEGEGDWPDYRRVVLTSLHRLEQSDKSQDEMLKKIDINLAILTTRVSLYAGGVAVVVTAIVEIVSRLFGK